MLQKRYWKEEEDDFLGNIMLGNIMRNAAFEDPEPAKIVDGHPKDARCKDVPSFDHLRQVQKKIRAEYGISTIPRKSPLGNVFFMNDPGSIIAQKWRKNMDLDMLSPMIDAGSSHYYVKEAVRLKDGKFVVPVRWVLFRGKVFAASTIKARHPSRMPNPKREITEGDPLYTSFVDYFGDDVSGNRTRSWNKHWNAYMTHRNLPRNTIAWNKSTLKRSKHTHHQTLIMPIHRTTMVRPKDPIAINPPVKKSRPVPIPRPNQLHKSFMPDVGVPDIVAVARGVEVLRHGCQLGEPLRDEGDGEVVLSVFEQP
ncbi:hypothetical protein B0H19DRAFT_1066470 [Mycena capillaripes]|nr:hypothetical protein B0H19DRAFT_1066470 [Mycena capillaripes]